MDIMIVIKVSIKVFVKDKLINNIELILAQV
jgi:hypothetical protein